MLENLLIARLPRHGQSRLLALSEAVRLRPGDVLSESGTRARCVYFPLDAVVSLVATVADSRLLGVGMVGREGMLGAHLALGVADAPVRAVVQGAGMARRIQAGPFRRELAQSEALHRALYRYVHVQLTQLATAAACVHFHLLIARLARWLLMSDDRTAVDGFRVTHEFLAHMLGVRREGVTEAAGALQQRLLIRYHRGAVCVLDRQGLESVACGCHAADQRAYDALLGP